MSEGGRTSAATAEVVTSADAVVTAAEDDEYQETSQQSVKSPRPAVWFITACNSPIGIAVARQLIERGDHVVAAVLPSEFMIEERSDEFNSFLEDVTNHNGGSELLETESQQLKVVGFDIKSVSECQSAVAEALQCFQYIDVLFCCNSQALFGTIEELNQTTHTQSLVVDQFHANFFGPVNIIKAVLPTLRSQRNGHIVLLTGITGHLGTPGLSMYCASQWAIEGYCDSLAYEIAPFNIKVSIVQSNIEINVLTNKIVSAPPMAAYMPPTNPAPLPRGTFKGLIDRLMGDNDPSDHYNNNDNEETTKDVHNASSGGNANVQDNENDAARATEERATAATQQSQHDADLEVRSSPGSALSADHINTFFPVLPVQFQANLIAETVHAVLAIGGHANPPSRHIVGAEGVTSVREKLKTVSEELEEFVECSAAVDL